MIRPFFSGAAVGAASSTTWVCEGGAAAGASVGRGRGGGAGLREGGGAGAIGCRGVISGAPPGGRSTSKLRGSAGTAATTSGSRCEGGVTAGGGAGAAGAGGAGSLAGGAGGAAALGGAANGGALGGDGAGGAGEGGLTAGGAGAAGTGALGAGLTGGGGAEGHAGIAVKSSPVFDGGGGGTGGAGAGGGGAAAAGGAGGVTGAGGGEGVVAAGGAAAGGELCGCIGRGGLPPIQATSSRPGSSIATIASVTAAGSGLPTRSTTAAAVKQCAPVLSAACSRTSVSSASCCLPRRMKRRSRSSG